MIKKKIVVLDYYIGNILSIQNAIEYLGHQVLITDKPKDIASATHLILPGVGAFGNAMNMLKNKYLDKEILKFSESNRPILGICLGMQLLFENSSEFGFNNGLGILKGNVVELPSRDKKNYSLKKPNIGWSKIDIKINYKNPTSIKIIKDLNDKDQFYYLNSFYALPKNKNICIATSKFYDYEFTGLVVDKNIVGCQFHPEKSAKSGLKILKNFLSIN